MAGKTDTFSSDLLKLIFNGTPIAGFADNAATSPLTNLYMSLHVTDPTDAAASGQNTGEASYGSYARKPLVRTTSGWSVSGKVATTLLDVDFPICTSGSGTLYYLGIGTHATGAGKLLYCGPLPSGIPYVIGTIPRIQAGTTVTED